MDKQKLDTLFDLTDRVAIVTGGTRGIGRAIAEGFGLAGAKVVVASRKAEACGETEEHLRSIGVDALGVPTHMGDLDALEGLVETTVERFGGIDIVVNNAATALAKMHGEYTAEAWDKSMAVNLRGPVFLVEAALEHLRRSEHASIINVLSGSAFMFSATVSMYAGAKAAMLAFTRSMAAEFAGSGIRVNALSPGTVNTDMVRANPPEAQQVMTDISLMRRMADPDELVGPALMLASDAGSFMTGQVVLVDGGMHPH